MRQATSTPMAKAPKQVSSANRPLLAEREGGGQDRRGGVDHGRVCVIVILEMAEKTVRQSRILRGSSESLADHGCFGGTAFRAQEIEQNIDSRVEGRIQRDAAGIHHAALGQMHDIGWNILCREVECELRERRFSFSHCDSPFLLRCSGHGIRRNTSNHEAHEGHEGFGYF
jgi:hypothetical protein